MLVNKEESSSSKYISKWPSSCSCSCSIKCWAVILMFVQIICTGFYFIMAIFLLFKTLYDSSHFIEFLKSSADRWLFLFLAAAVFTLAFRISSAMIRKETKKIPTKLVCYAGLRGLQLFLLFCGVFFVSTHSKNFEVLVVWFCDLILLLIFLFVVASQSSPQLGAGNTVVSTADTFGLAGLTQGTNLEFQAVQGIQSWSLV